MKKQNGFTLVEAIIALFIGSLMLVAIYKTVNMGQISSSKVERGVSAQQDARGALELMAMEIQMASYNSLLVNNIWVSPTDCNSASSNMGYRGIQAATANSITVEMDINDNGVINNNTTNNPNETITYTYDSTNKYITRSTNCTGGNQPFLGATNASADSKTVLVENNSAGIPVFRYYNGSGTDISGTVVSNPTDTTLGIPAIRRIEITLVVDTSSGNVATDSATSNKRRIIYSTSVIPRNHTPPLY